MMLRSTFDLPGRNRKFEAWLCNHIGSRSIAHRAEWWTMVGQCCGWLRLKLCRSGHAWRFRKRLSAYLLDIGWNGTKLPFAIVLPFAAVLDWTVKYRRRPASGTAGTAAML